MKSAKWYAAMRARRGKGTNQYTKAKKLGLPKPLISDETRRKQSIVNKRPHSEETKKKISQSRIKYLEENPDKVPYKLNHYSKGRSYPEEYWKTILDSNNLIYEEQYPINLYSLDFAFINQKINLEIDGDQHYLDKRIILSDKRRNQYLEMLGWTIIRIKWSAYKALTDKPAYVNFIISQLRTGNSAVECGTFNSEVEGLNPSGSTKNYEETMYEYPPAELTASKMIKLLSTIAYKERHGMDASSEHIAAKDTFLLAIKECIRENLESMKLKIDC